LTTSRHPVIDPAFYLDITKTGFASFYGPIENYCVLALLPAYLERQGSSLVYMTRDELHAKLKDAFNLTAVHSEYGMTELLSQAYSTGNGWFQGGPSFQVLVREITDPFSYVSSGKTGLLNIIDLANVDSCSFIATDDLGQVAKDGSFRVMGRLDASDIRGCNLMVE